MGGFSSPRITTDSPQMGMGRGVIPNLPSDFLFRYVDLRTARTFSYFVARVNFYYNKQHNDTLFMLSLRFLS